MLHAFKDSEDGYYQIELAEGESLPEWAQLLTPCPVITLPEVVTVPQEVTRFQALAVLHLRGLLTRVKAMMADPATDPLTVLAFDSAQTFKRCSPMVMNMALALGLSDQQLDDLFITASQIE